MEILKVFTKKLRYHRKAERTIEVYCSYLKEFLRSELIKDPYQVTTIQISTYLENRNYTSASTQNQVIGSLKAFAKYVLGKSQVHLDKIHRVKKNTRLQPVIPREILLQKLKDIKNPKHKAIIAIAYCCALRVSEVINLQWKHLSREEGIIYILNAKGNKDRIAPLTPPLIKILDAHARSHKTGQYVFTGQDWRPQYSPTSCNKIVKTIFGDRYRFHSLRKSSATHLYELGNDLSKIQDLLGHSKGETTRVYVQKSAKSMRHLTELI